LPSSAKSCERMVAVSASRTIRAVAPASPSHFPHYKPQTRSSPAGALRETRDERRPQRATEQSASLNPIRSSATAIFQLLPYSSDKRRRLEPSPLSGTRRFREEKRRAIRLNRRRRHRCRREGDPFASRLPFWRPPHSRSQSLRYIGRCGRWRRSTIRRFAISPTPPLRLLGGLPQ